MMRDKNHESVTVINIEGSIPQDIEYAVLEALVQGRKAAVAEVAVRKTLQRPGGNSRPVGVTEWANEFSANYRIQWKRRQRCGDLLFSREQPGGR